MASAKSTAMSPSKETLGDESANKASSLRPLEHAIDLLGARWTLILIRHLLTDQHGFQELRDRTGITPRLLSVRLSELISHGFVEKVPFGNRARYTLTDFGKSVEPIVREMALWWLQHALPRFGPDLGADPATVFEAVSYLIQRNQATDVGARYDLRLTVREDGAWAVNFTDGSNQESPKRQATQDAVAESITDAVEPQRSEDTERLTETRVDARPVATDAGARGSIVWHPKPYRPDHS